MRQSRYLFLLFFFALLRSVSANTSSADDETIDPNTFLFTKVLSKNAGKIPYPFEEFTKIPGSSRQALLIPKGRSLQKDKTNFSDPRVLYSYGPGLFLGYAAKSEQVEVISWNERTKKYDFLLIQDYGPNKVPRTVTPERKLCVSCHQGEAPIFSRDPWGEVAPQFFPSLNKQTDTVHEKLADALKDAQKYQGAIVHRRGEGLGDGLPVILSFDNDVRMASTRLQAQGACALCMPNQSCRQKLLQAAVTREGFDLFGGGALAQQIQSEVESEWPEDGFSFSSSVIPSRNPLGGASRKGTIARVVAPDPTADPKTRKALELFDSLKLSYFKSAQGIDLTFSELRADLEANIVLPPVSRSVEEEYVDGRAGDPKFIRPKVAKIPKDRAGWYLAFNAPTCFGLESEDEEILRSYRSRQKEAALESGLMRKFIESKPKPTSTETMRTLLVALGADKIPECYQPGNPEVTMAPMGNILKIAKEVVSSTPPVVEKPQATSLFNKYCAQCHAGPGAVLDLPLSETKRLKSYRTHDKTSVLDLINYHKMPPANSPQPTEPERKQMLKELR